ncbi:MAG: hypothetical protein AAF420_04255 [Pseudomonadota bacterium]
MSTAVQITPEEVVFYKTDLGREEIAHRRDGLPKYLRTLLLLIDGKQTVGELLDSLSDMRYELHHFYELVRRGYIIDTMHRIDPKSLASQAGQLDDTVEMTANAEALLAKDEATGFDWDAPLPGTQPEPAPDNPRKKKLYPW